MTPHVRRDVNPGAVQFHRLLLRVFVGCSYAARAVHHDQRNADVVRGGILDELIDIRLFGGREHTVN